MVPSNHIALLFCHGSSFTKETWEPVTRRLEASELLQRIPCDFITFDWQYHGEKYDHSEPAELTYVNGTKRVEHPARYWPISSQATLLQRLEEIRQQDENSGTQTHIVVIGHSMGAAALFKYEVNNPGTFEGYIGFEPIYDSGVYTAEQLDAGRDLLVSVSLAREGEWATKEAAIEHIKSSKAFRRWHPEALDAYLKSALIETENKVKLAMTPMQEAAGFCHEFIQFTPEILSRAQCKIFIEHAERSFFFHVQPMRALGEKLSGKLVLGEPLPNTSHVMIMEDPDATAERILFDLAQLPLFQ